MYSTLYCYRHWNRNGIEQRIDWRWNKLRETPYRSWGTEMLNWNHNCKNYANYRYLYTPCICIYKSCKYKEILYSWKFLSTPIFEDFEVLESFPQFFVTSQKLRSLASFVFYLYQFSNCLLYHFHACTCDHKIFVVNIKYPKTLG